MEQNSKGKFFFFGQPGCLNRELKLTPIRTTNNKNPDTQNDNDLTKGDNENNKDDKLPLEEHKEGSSSDEDSEKLLKKISEALDENTEEQNKGLVTTVNADNQLDATSNEIIEESRNENKLMEDEKFEPEKERALQELTANEIQKENEISLLNTEQVINNSVLDEPHNSSSEIVNIDDTIKEEKIDSVEKMDCIEEENISEMKMIATVDDNTNSNNIECEESVNNIKEHLNLKVEISEELGNVENKLELSELTEAKELPNKSETESENKATNSDCAIITINKATLEGEELKAEIESEELKPENESEQIVPSSSEENYEKQKDSETPVTVEHNISQSNLEKDPQDFSMNEDEEDDVDHSCKLLTSTVIEKGLHTTDDIKEKQETSSNESSEESAKVLRETILFKEEKIDTVDLNLMKASYEEERKDNILESPSSTNTTNENEKFANVECLTDNMIHMKESSEVEPITCNENEKNVEEKIYDLKEEEIDDTKNNKDPEAFETLRTEEDEVSIENTFDKGNTSPTKETDDFIEIEEKVQLNTYSAKSDKTSDSIHEKSENLDESEEPEQLEPTEISQSKIEESVEIVEACEVESIRNECKLENDTVMEKELDEDNGDLSIEVHKNETIICEVEMASSSNTKETDLKESAGDHLFLKQEVLNDSLEIIQEKNTNENEIKHDELSSKSPITFEKEASTNDIKNMIDEKEELQHEKSVSSDIKENEKVNENVEFTNENSEEDNESNEEEKYQNKPPIISNEKHFKEQLSIDKREELSIENSIASEELNKNICQSDKNENLDEDDDSSQENYQNDPSVILNSENFKDQVSNDKKMNDLEVVGTKIETAHFFKNQSSDAFEHQVTKEINENVIDKNTKDKELDFTEVTQNDDDSVSHHPDEIEIKESTQVIVEKEDNINVKINSHEEPSTSVIRDNEAIISADLSPIHKVESLTVENIDRFKNKTSDIIRNLNEKRDHHELEEEEESPEEPLGKHLKLSTENIVEQNNAVVSEKTIHIERIEVEEQHISESVKINIMDLNTNKNENNSRDCDIFEKENILNIAECEGEQQEVLDLKKNITAETIEENEFSDAAKNIQENAPLESYNQQQQQPPVEIIEEKNETNLNQEFLETKEVVVLPDDNKEIEAKEPEKTNHTEFKNDREHAAEENIQEDTHEETVLTKTLVINSKIEDEDPFSKIMESKQQKSEKSDNANQVFTKLPATRKRKLSEKKCPSESDSDGGNNFAVDSMSNDNHSEEEEEEIVVTKKPRIRGKVVATRNTRATRQSLKVAEVSLSESNVESKKDLPEEKKDLTEEKTLQNIKFDYDENEDIVANVAAIKTLICKDPPKDVDESNRSSDDESNKKITPRRGRKTKRGRATKVHEAQDSSSEDETKSTIVPDSKRTKTAESEDALDKQQKKKRESGGKVESEAPIRQSRRIAQQKIREETERRQMEEKMLKKMKEDAERKKKGDIPEDLEEEPEEKESSDESKDESYKGSPKKKTKKIKASDKPWQTSSSHSEHTETEEEYEHPHSEDPGSPLFRSDHEFSPESDVDDATPIQPLKRARTAKKQIEESSDDEDVNPNHACQVCHKTDSPEWILLCDECDHGYHCSCLKPIIFCIPSGNWYCPLCCHKKLIENLGLQLEKLDALVEEMEAEEIRKQKQLEIKKLTEITAENILNDKRKSRLERNLREERRLKSRDEEEGLEESDSNDESSDNSSDNAPLNEYFYKLRRRNQTTASYRFNDYDELINSAIRDEMEEVKGLGNAGRGKDISTIIEADKEEKKLQRLEKEKATTGDERQDDEEDDAGEQQKEKEDDEESSGSDIIRSKKSMQRKKKNRKLNNLDETSEEDKVSDEDFKGSSSSDTEEEDYSMSSVSESSLDLPKKKKMAQRSTRSATKNRRYDETFIDDNTSDDEPLIKTKRPKKINDSDEEDFDANDDENEDSEGSTANEIDSDDLCDDTDTDDSSEGNWPKKKKKRVASYDIKKPRKPAKKHDEDEDRAFRAGISKKKILKKSENESEGSGSENIKGRRKTRGKKLLYLIEDDYESDDGIKPGIGVIRPETPPEEREMFVKKQEEIKRMLAAKNTEAARQLAVPTIEPIQFALEKPMSPSLPPDDILPVESTSSLSTIPKNVIEGAKALDADYNRIKPLHFGINSKQNENNLASQEMSEEELAKMMEEEDFAQHQLKLAGEAIARSNKLLELEVKEEAFAPFSKVHKLKEEKDKTIPSETKKRSRKLKITEKPPVEVIPVPAPAPKLVHPDMLPLPHSLQQLPPRPIPTTTTVHEALKTPITSPISQNSVPSIPPLIPNVPHPFASMQRFQNPNQPLQQQQQQDRPSVLSNFIPRHEIMSRHEILPPIHQQPLPQIRFQPQLHTQLQVPQQSQQPAQSREDTEEKKKGRRKKFTPLRSDLPESNVPKVAKLDTPVSSVIHSTLNLSSERIDDKSKVLPPLSRAKTMIDVASSPQIFNPATNTTPSVITRLLQPQRLGPPFGGSFNEQINLPATNPDAAPPTSRVFTSSQEPKLISVAKQVRSGISQPASASSNLPQAPFNENPFVPRTMHPLYRGAPTSSQPSIYGIPSHARIPYPFHPHLHPNNNLRPSIQEYGAPYTIQPQFGYYAPPAHSRQPQNPPTTSAAVPLSAHPEDVPPNSIIRINPSDEPSESSEFGGLVSYFSQQQELD